MRENPLKVKFRKGEPVVGLFCNLPSPAAVEVLGLLGYDFVIIDAEHGVSDLETCEHMLRAAEVVGITPIVRVAVNLPQNILRYLDAGAMGLQIPMVNTRAEAEAVVAAARYPPLGRRGLAGVRANRYGVAGSLGEYVQQANREVLVCVQLETRTAIQNAADIVTVEGIDVIFAGPSDLSAALGYPGQPTHPEVMAAVQGIGRLAQKAGKVAGTIARDGEAYAGWRREGFLYLASGIVSVLASGARALLEACREKEKALAAQRAPGRGVGGEG